MLLNLNDDPHGHSTCALSYNEQERWLQAVWQGYIDPLEAQRGAEAYLQHAGQHPSAFLLNDNLRLQGPWFESLDWLRDVWVPGALALGLRYVAHIVQADRQTDSLVDNQPLHLPFELQLFQDREDACHWLREMRDASPPVEAQPTTPEAVPGTNAGA